MKKNFWDFEEAPERDNYVIDPTKKKAVAKIVAQDNAVNTARAADTKVLPNGVVESGALDVSGYLEEPKKPNVKETISKAMAEVPPYNRSEEESIPAYSRKETIQTTQYAQPQKKDEGFPWDRALIGATPLLVGLLTGNQMEGVQIAGNHLVKDEGDLYKRERDLAAKISEMQAKRTLAADGNSGVKRYTPQNIAMKDGTNIKGVFDTFTGRYLRPDNSEIDSNFIRTGYAVNPEEFNRRKVVTSEHKRDDADYLGTNTRINPTDGQLGVVRSGKITPVQGQDTGLFNVKQEKDIKEAQKEFTSSIPYKDSVQSLTLAPQVSALLDAASRTKDPNSIAGNSVILTMIRQAQRVGIASDKDAQAMGGTQQWTEAITRITDRLLGSGKPLTDRDVQDLREISSIYTKRSKELLGDYYAEKRGSFASRYNLDPGIIDQHIGAEVRPYMSSAEKTIVAKNAPQKIRFEGREWSSPSREKSMPFTIPGDGNVYWEPPSMWDQIKRETPGAKRLDK